MMQDGGTAGAAAQNAEENFETQSGDGSEVERESGDEDPSSNFLPTLSEINTNEKITVVPSSPKAAQTIPAEAKSESGVSEDSKVQEKTSVEQKASTASKQQKATSEPQFEEESKVLEVIDDSASADEATQESSSAQEKSAK